MNLASFYLCLFMNMEAAFKCDIVGKEDNYKYLVALYTLHFRERFIFYVFFSWAIYDKMLKFSFILGYFVWLRDTLNVEVKEKSVVCHAS